MTHLLTYLLTRVKSRATSVAKNGQICSTERMGEAEGEPDCFHGGGDQVLHHHCHLDLAVIAKGHLNFRGVKGVVFLPNNRPAAGADIQVNWNSPMLYSF